LVEASDLVGEVGKYLVEFSTGEMQMVWWDMAVWDVGRGW
jgi:hypothetical protein